MQFLAARQRVAYLEVSGIGKADYITRKGFIYRLFFLRHEACRRGKTHLLLFAHVVIIRIPQELTAAYLEECDTRAVVRVHVRVNLKAESVELILHRLYRALFGHYGTRRRRISHEEIQQLLNADRLIG